MQDLTAHLLVAIPELADENFYRSVVLLLHHSADGASGVVLNRPSNHKISDIWEEVSGHPSDCAYPIHIGGPVDGPMIALHQSPELAEVKILEGVYLSMDCEKINQLVASSNSLFHLFSCYSGWGPQQLENEIKHGGWLAIPARATHVFGDPESLWKTVCQEIGNKILIPAKAKTPTIDPSCN